MKTLLALNAIKLGSLSFREVVAYENGECYLDNVNIILNNKIIKKLRYEAGEKPYVESMGKSLVEDYFLSLIQNDDGVSVDKKKKRKSKVVKGNKKVRAKAAVDLMKEFGL